MELATTVRQLAALAGVSRSTVSLALRNHPSISAATRDRIQELARRNGYRNDPLVASLMTQLRVSRKNRSAETVAYLTSWNSPWEWKTHPNDPDYYAGACRRAVELGYRIDHFWAREPGMTQARLSKILYSRGIRGVVIAPLLRARGHLSLEWSKFAVATISNTVYKPDIHRASHLHYNGMITAIRSLKHRGYRRIGLATLIDQDERVNHGWQAAFLFNYYNSPVAQRISPFLTIDWKKRQFKEWLRKHSPDVVISNTDVPCQLLQELGYGVPEDIGFASLDVQPNAHFSGINQLGQEVGACAVDLMAIQLQNNELGLPRYARTVHIQGLWVDGETTLLSKSQRPTSHAKKRAVTKKS